MTPQAPAPRPARGTGRLRAESWIIAAALIVALTYGFRRII